MQNGQNHPHYESSYCSIDIGELLANLQATLDQKFNELEAYTVEIQEINRRFSSRSAQAADTATELAQNEAAKYTAATNREIEHIEEQIVYLERGSLTVKRLDDGSEFIPFFPTHIVKTLDGSIGTVTYSTATTVNITLTNGTKTWSKPKNLKHLRGFAKRSGPVERQVAAFAQAENQESNGSSDEEESHWDPALAELIRLVNQSNGEGDHDQSEYETESDDGEYNDEYGHESDN